MARLFLQIMINALGIAITARLLPGIHVVNEDLFTYILMGAVFGILNAVIWPLMTCLTCAVILFTFGLFLFVINGMALWFTAELFPDRLQIDSFGWAIIGGLVMSIIGTILRAVLGVDDDKPEIRIERG